MRLRYLVLALAGVAVLFGGGHAFAQAGAPPAGWSASDCQSCHEKAVGPTFQQYQARERQPQSCATCHTNVAEHMKAQMAGDKNAPVPSLKKLTATQISDTCLKCHEKGGQQNWHGGMHERRNVGCTSCHSVHSFKSKTAPAEDRGRTRSRATRATSPSAPRRCARRTTRFARARWSARAATTRTTGRGRR